jgi:hypothetical protein
MKQAPYKGLIQHLQSYITKCNRKYNFEILANFFQLNQNWLMKKNVDKETSTNYRNHPTIINSQSTYIWKFYFNQYIGNACKNLFFGPKLYPSITHLKYCIHSVFVFYLQKDTIAMQDSNMLYIRRIPYESQPPQ